MFGLYRLEIKFYQKIKNGIVFLVKKYIKIRGLDYCYPYYWINLKPVFQYKYLKETHVYFLLSKVKSSPKILKNVTSSFQRYKVWRNYETNIYSEFRWKIVPHNERGNHSYYLNNWVKILDNKKTFWPYFSSPE